MSSDSLPFPQHERQFQTDRLVALWALSEAALGGALHAFRIPLTGLLVNSTAVILIVLISSFSPKKGTILKATFIVMIVKGIVSPHTPLAAYVSVGFQGLMGEFLLRSKKYVFVSSVILGGITLLQSSIQKIVVLTLVYGKALWESINLFGNFVMGQFSFLPSPTKDVDFSYWIITTYIMIHLCVGILVGIFAARLPKWVKHEINRSDPHSEMTNKNNFNNLIVKKRKKKWYQKLTTIAIFSLAACIVALSYIYPDISEQQGVKAVIMILRAAGIMMIWYALLGPQLQKFYHRYMDKKQNNYTKEVQNALRVLPVLHHVISRTWQSSRSFRGIHRLKMFIIFAVVNILSMDV